MKPSGGVGGFAIDEFSRQNFASAHFFAVGLQLFVQNFEAIASRQIALKVNLIRKNLNQLVAHGARDVIGIHSRIDGAAQCGIGQTRHGLQIAGFFGALQLASVIAFDG